MPKRNPYTKTKSNWRPPTKKESAEYRKRKRKQKGLRGMNKNQRKQLDKLATGR